MKDYGKSLPFCFGSAESEADEVQKSHDSAALSGVDQLGVEYGECGSGKLHSALSGRHL